MGFGEAIKSGFTNFANFKGRARRSEFWYFVLFYYMVSLGGTFIFGLIGSALETSAFSGIFTLASYVLLVPFYAALVRRLHDTDRNATLVIVHFALKVVAVIIAIIFIAVLAGQMISAGFYDYEDILDSMFASMMVFVVLFLLIGLGSLAVTIILIVYCCEDSKYYDNQYGLCPKVVFAGYDANGNPIFTYPINAQYQNPQMNNGQMYNNQMYNNQMNNGQMYNNQMNNGQYQNMQMNNGQYQNTQINNGQYQNPQMNNGQYQNSQMNNGQYQNMQMNNGQNQNPQMNNNQMGQSAPVNLNKDNGAGQFSGANISQTISEEAKVDPEKQHFDNSVYQDNDSMWK